MIPAAIAGVVALIIGVLVATSGDDTKTTTGGGGGGGPGEIFLQPISAPGPDPFGPSIAGPTPSSTVPPGTPITLGPNQTAPVFPPGPSIPPEITGPLTLNATSGATPGLYGGTRDQASCNKQQMIEFLAANPDKAREWARVQGIDPANIGVYINDMTPVLLRNDTRVTNHGFANGAAYPIQSVLQAGTAVLVDKFGAPRARCACGNPLIDPKPLSVTPTYQGTPWPGFSPTNITVINSSTTVINIITIIDVSTGTPLGRTTGQGGGPDVTLPPGGTTTTPPTGVTTTRPPGSTTTAPPGSSWRLREIKIAKANFSSEPNVQITRAASATGGEMLVTFPDAGLCSGQPGTATNRFSWTLGRDVTTVRNGDPPIPVTVTAAGAGTTGACVTAFGARAFMTVGGSDGDGSAPASAFTRPIDQPRFSGETGRAVPTEQGGSQTASGSIMVSSRPSNAGAPTAWFGVKVQAPGLQFYVLYIYELA